MCCTSMTVIAPQASPKSKAGLITNVYKLVIFPGICLIEAEAFSQIMVQPDFTKKVHFNACNVFKPLRSAASNGGIVMATSGLSSAIKGYLLLIQQAFTLVSSNGTVSARGGQQNEVWPEVCLCNQINLSFFVVCRAWNDCDKRSRRWVTRCRVRKCVVVLPCFQHFCQTCPLGDDLNMFLLCR